MAQKEADNIGLAERLIGRIYFVRKPYKQRKARQRAEASLYEAYRRTVGDPQWASQEFETGLVSFTIRLGTVPLTGDLEFVKAPNGKYTVLWPFTDGTRLPVEADTLEQLRRALESCVTVIYMATMDKFQAVAAESGYKVNLTKEHPVVDGAPTVVGPVELAAAPEAKAS